MAASELIPGPTAEPTAIGPPPAAMGECRRVVAVTICLPELLLRAAGLLQRLGAAEIHTDILVAAATDPESDGAAEVGLRELGVSGLARHRLALPVPFGEDRVDDLVAAMSELVGFDPEPEVFCLASTTDRRDPCRAALTTATDRIVSVYGLALVDVCASTGDDSTDLDSIDLELNATEWTRKCAALAACCSQLTPLSGHREHFTVRAARLRR